MRLSRLLYFPELRASAYILYINQYAGITVSRSWATSLFTKENGMGIFSSAGKSPLAIIVNEANLELCFKLTQRPGQNPLLAINSPSGPLELWLDPMVAPAAILL